MGSFLNNDAGRMTTNRLNNGVAIDDILESVTRGYEAEELEGIGGLESLSSSSDRQQDLQKLTQAWVAERVAPELLPYPSDLMERTMTRIRQQLTRAADNPRLEGIGIEKIETIEDVTARMDGATSFMLVIMQTELERFKFLVRTFLRTRLAKMDLHPLYLRNLHEAQQQQQSSSEGTLLSPQELQYLTAHSVLLERHYKASFLASFPSKLQQLDDRAGAGGVSMIEGPDIDKAVFVRCLGIPRDAGYVEDDGHDMLDDRIDDDHQAKDQDPYARYGPVEVSCGFTGASQDASNGGTRMGSSQLRSSNVDSRSGNGSSIANGRERRVRMRRGEIWIIRWSAVQEAVRSGECELI